MRFASGGKWALAWLAGCVLAACGSTPQRDAMNNPMASQPAPPMAATQPYQVVAPHGASREDPYYWLRDDSRENPEVIAYLEAENAYTDALLAPQAEVRSTLYDEIVARIKPDDASVPFLEKGYWYYSRYEEGGQYPIHARRKGSMEAPEEILLDGNALAQDKGYFQIGSYEVSPGGRLLAWVEDDVGRRQYTLDQGSGHRRDAGGCREGITPALVWGADEGSIYYIQNDPETLLGKRVMRHRLGSPASAANWSTRKPTKPSIVRGPLRRVPVHHAGKHRLQRAALRRPAASGEFRTGSAPADSCTTPVIWTAA